MLISIKLDEVIYIKNLVFVRASDKSLHKEWIEPKNAKTFELYIEYYGEHPKRYREDADYYSHNQTGTKFPRFFDIISQNQSLLNDFDAVWIVDDDISISADTISSMFELFHLHHLWLAQPALTKHSNLSFPTLFQDPQYTLRYTNFIEAMAPIFSKSALQKCWRTFEKSTSGWGLDFVWPKLLEYPSDRIAVIDATPISHTRVSGDLYSSINVNPFDEMNHVCEIYAVRNEVDKIKIFGGIPNEN
ncbi:hypothetical protein J2Y03_004900 [Neobacillus niacini]|uniref:DUF707 domain-containing protein n=1 Tax=Neobacillus niacini TaxID=86668 RepID=UPI002860E7D7|nr:DUF707 domain-containing protein [Neobacillus niacini]MDR7079842.1 hypothetical protein [Neobacillus niacini]